MSRPRPSRGALVLALVAAAGALAAILAGTGVLSRSAPHAASSTAAPRGGTLHVGVVAFPGFPRSGNPIGVKVGLDPQIDDTGEEVFRCCLLRTLLAYPGRATDQGGAELPPDLASALPTASQDLRTWTFRIQPGLHYAPPLAGTEITAGDFVRALQREARLGQKTYTDSSYAAYYSIIRGFDDFASGRAQTIAGLATPDAHTLVIHLSQPAADLGHRFTLPATAPIPPAPRDPSAPYGVAQGHDTGYGHFLVASGPYMIAGSDRLTPSAAPGAQRPVSGFVPDQSITLVRNPSWTPATDHLRPAYADRIELVLGKYLHEDAAAQDAGRLDVLLYGGPPLQAPRSLVARYLHAPTRGRVEVHSRNSVRFISINLAVPPFDDVHVRRAIAFALDKRALVAAQGGALAGEPTGHLADDYLEQNALRGVDPFATPGERGSLRGARQEMARSRYDRNHDGRCDTATCQAVRALVFPLPQFRAIGQEVRRDLAPIGIQLRVEALDPPSFFAAIEDPRSHVPLALTPIAGAGTEDASQLFSAFLGSQIGRPAALNYMLLGASRDKLRRWGYRVTHVPSADRRIAECLGLVGDTQTTCWAALDLYLSAKIVPWVPYISEFHVDVVPARVAGFSFDQTLVLPALDGIAVSPERR